MKIETIQGPSLVQPTGARTEQQMSAREKAIAALLRPNTPAQAAAQSQPVPNATQISPEEASAAGFKRSSTATIEDPAQGQKYTSESGEAPASEPKEETKVSSEPLSSQYAALARRERAIRDRERQLKAKELEAKAASEAPKAAEMKPSIDPSKYVDKDRLTKDPFTVLSELGLTYDQLTEMAMNAPNQDNLILKSQLKLLEDKIAKLEGETENTKKSFHEQQETQRKQALRQMKSDAVNLVKGNEQFETIAATDSYDDVVDLIAKTFDEEGTLMSVEEAAQLVEDHLVEEAMKLARLNKIKQRMMPKEASAAPQASEKSDAQPQQPQMKTLTNSVASSRQLSAKERAILAFQGKLQTK